MQKDKKEKTNQSNYQHFKKQNIKKFLSKAKKIFLKPFICTKNHVEMWITLVFFHNKRAKKSILHKN